MLEAWMRDGDPARELVHLLERDPVIAKRVAGGTIMRLAPSLGFAADTWLWVLGYVREALEPGAETAKEASRLLRFLRMERGVVPARVRTTLFGLEVEDSVELPFGRLLPGTARDLAIAASPDLPPIAVFECVVDCAAGLTHDRHDMVWTIEEGERLEAEMHQRVDEQGLGRLLIALVFCHPAGPIQEHVVAVGPLYGERFVGLNAVPLGVVWGTPRGRGERPTIDAGELREVADVVASLSDPRRIVVAARRYFRAGAERARPSDALVDFTTAIEALAGTSSGKRQSEWMVELLGTDPAWRHRLTVDFKELKHARNQILHDGVTPPGARALVAWTRALIEHAIVAAVRRDAGVAPVGIFDPYRPRWPPTR